MGLSATTNCFVYGVEIVEERVKIGNKLQANLGMHGVWWFAQTVACGRCYYGIRSPLFGAQAT